MGRPPAKTKLGQKRIHIVRARGGNLKRRALRLDTGNYSWGTEALTRKTRILGVVYNASNNELVRTNTLVKNSIVTIDAAPFRQWYEQHYGINLGKKKAATIVTTAKDAKGKAKGGKEKPKQSQKETPKQSQKEKPKQSQKENPKDKAKSEKQEAPKGQTKDTKEAKDQKEAADKGPRKITKKLRQRQKSRQPVESALETQFAKGRLLACVSSRPGQVGRCDGYILEGKELDFYQKKIHQKKKGKSS